MSLPLRWGVVAIAALAAMALPPAVTIMRAQASSPAAPALDTADFGAQQASPQARRLGGWVARTRDNGGRDFIIVDKRRAEIHVFDSLARLRASSPVLLGSTPGDDTVPGIGQRPLAEISPDERTTPAGRFVAESGRNLRDEDVLWISYADALSMHPVLTTNPDERRLERLATPTPDDNRVSYGCINVPTEFFDATLRPLLGRRTVVYILPETTSLDEVFAMRPRGRTQT